MKPIISLLLLSLLLSSCSVNKTQALQALSQGDEIKVLSYLKSHTTGDDILDEYGNTFLHLAVMTKKENILKAVLKSGIDTETPTASGQTALHLALQNSDPVITALLINSGANINAVNKKDRGKSALHYAVVNRSVECVKLLVVKGADIEILDDIGAGPLNWAAYVGDLATVKYLVSAGADLGNKDHYSDTPLTSSKANPDPEIYKFLLETSQKK